MAELLLEMFSEEIPARMQARAADDLRRLVCDGLKDAQLSFDRADAYVTPRRLALVVDGLSAAQPDVREERRGPRADAPAQAIEGFLKSAGLTRDAVEERETPKGIFLFATIEKKGVATKVVLASLLPTAVGQLPWPKSMRWGSSADRWVRPLHRILCLFDGDVVPVTAAGVEAGNATVGHRFLAPDAFDVTGFADYRDTLRAAKVMLDGAERRSVIESEAKRLAAADGLTLRDDPALLDEVAGLVEWPVVHLGRIDEAFMDVPEEVLITSMRSHQKYFALLDADGKLAPRFAVVANTETADGGVQVVAGNERVLRARLSDAKFFWDQDRKQSLENRLPRLAERVFHAKLGSDMERVARIAELAGRLAGPTGADAALAERAARLAKADLTTEMVGEFPELQGIMGRYYAVHDGEPGEVADAIAEHYSPLGPSDRCPNAPVSVAVALADKIDTLVGFFGIDEKPTGSKDPFALRRAALGVIRLIIENDFRLPLLEVFDGERKLYVEAAYKGEPGDDSISVAGFAIHGRAGWPQPHTHTAWDLIDFLADRLKVHLKGEGVRHDLITAVFARGGEDDLVRLLARVDALKRFLDTDDGANLLTAYKRASNIVRIEEKKDGASYDGEADARLFEQPEESGLHGQLDLAKGRISDALERERFGEAMAVLAELRAPVDAFFDHVTVNCEDAGLRVNRLRLLSQIRSALGGVADFSHIEG